MLVQRVPSPCPPSLWGEPRKSPRLAPSGRVRMNASQKHSTGPAPSRQATKIAAINPAGSSTDGPGPQAVSSNVQSPAAVPSANVTKTVSQKKDSRGDGISVCEDM